MNSQTRSVLLKYPCPDIKGDRTPKGPIISNIARVLHTTSDYLLGHEVEAEDTELVYYRTQRAIARNAEKWSKKQKADLVNALFGVEDES